MSEHFSGSSFYVYFSVIAVNLITFTSTASWSWTSPILPKLTSSDPSINPLQRPVTTLEESWIASAMNVGAIVGGLVSGVASGKFGKKTTILVFGIPVILGHVLCAVALSVEFFIVARLLMGISLGMVFGVIPGYVTDIAEIENRGSLSSVLGVSNCCGILSMYVVGPFLSVRVFSLVNLVVPVVFCVVFGIFGPHSPYDLVKQGKHNEAEATLVKLRNKCPADVQKELIYINQNVHNSLSILRGFRMLFTSKTGLKALAISNSLLLFQQLSGTVAIVGYMQTIFESTGTSISPTYSSMIIGSVQLLANLVSAQLIERLGRKLLLILSYIFCIISLGALGTYFLIPMPGLSWLPIGSLVLYMLAFNLGLANIPWVITAELFSSNLKTAALAFSAFFSFLLTFLVNISFPIAAAAFGMTAVFWTFAAGCFVGLVMCFVSLFETKGKSVEEIQKLLEGIVK